jgi:hypothetical protein
LSRHASSIVESELPLRGYFLSVGGALLLLLLAADWVLPAPLPSRLDPRSPLPKIRIHSELKGPEAVVIDTGGFGLRPILAEHDTTEHDVVDASSQQPQTEVVDAAVGLSDSRRAPTDLRLRGSLAQLQPAVHDQAGRGSRPHEITARPRKLAQARSAKRRRSARHPGFEISSGSCASLRRERGPCRYALMPD